MSRSLIRSRLWQALAIALVVVAVAGAGFWQSQRAKPGAAQADSSIPGIETLQSVERALVAVVERVKPAVVRIEAEQAPPQQEMRGEEEQGETPDELLRRFFEESPQFRVPRPTPQPSTSLGSGVIIDPAGYVLTARHVVKDADKIWVELDSGEKLRGKVLAMDSETDLAVVKVESSKPLPAAPLGDADTLRAGAYVIAIGSPFNLKHSVSVGYVSATERMIRRMDVEGRAYRHMIQTDAAINRGNSGGPLVDIEGKVVGINNMIFSATGYNVGIGFAVAINGVTKKVIATLEEGKQVQRGLLGVQILDVDKAIAFWYAAKEGAFINDVNPGGAADKAGMQDEDIIVQFGDAKVTNVEGLVTAVQATKPGVRVPVKVVREGKPMSLDVVLGALEAQAAPQPAAAKAGGPLGITVQDMTRGLAERYGIQGQSGVVVTEVNPAGDAARTGIRAGDVLTKINRTDTKTVKDYEEAAGKLKPGDPVVLRVLRGGKKNTLTIESLGE